MTRSRRGFVLPLVLVGGFLLAGLVVAFHFVSASDTRGIVRLERSIQAGLLADLASDEIAEQVSTITFGTGDPKPQWVTDLFAELARQRTGTPPFKVNVSASSLDVSKLPLTQAAAKKVAGTLVLNKVTPAFGPFTFTSAEPPLIYRDKDVYKDTAKELRSYDLRGPLAVELEFQGDAGPFSFGQKFQRGQELMITDTSPPAEEFALFSFLPPPTKDYALNELSGGGKLLVDTSTADSNQSARLHMRGPLFMISEDAPSRQPDPTSNEPQVMYVDARGDPVDSNGHKSTAFPDGKWAGSFGAIPGPRTVLHTGSTVSAVDQALGGVKSAFEEAVGGNVPIRPEHLASLSHLKTRPGFDFYIDVTATVTIDVPLAGPQVVTKSFPHTKFHLPEIDWHLHDISLSISNNLKDDEAVFISIDRSEAAYYPPSAYLFGPASPDSSKFQVQPTLSSVRPGCFRGVRVPIGGGKPVKWDGTNAGGLAEGDLFTTEPVPINGQPPGANAGVVSVYGVALFESKTLFVAKAEDVCRNMLNLFVDTEVPSFPAFIRDVARQNIPNAIPQALQQLGLSKDMNFLLRRFHADSKMDYKATTALDAGDLSAKLSSKAALIAPFGTYWHLDDFLRSSSLIPADIKDKMKDALVNPHGTLTGDAALAVLLPRKKDPEFTPDYRTEDPDWPLNQMPNDGVPTPAKQFRDWMCGDYAQSLMKCVLGGAVGAPEAMLSKLLDLPKAPQGIPELGLGSGKRPHGVLGDYLADAPSQPAGGMPAAADYPSGFFPPRHRDWDHIVTRRYATMDELIAANYNPAKKALELRGAMLVETMDYSKQALTYHGRGIIVCSSDDKKVAKLTCDVGPVDATSLLVLVHRVPGSMLKDGKAPQIQLGSKFQGSVYSDSGVKPQTPTQLIGNLVCGLTEKSNTGGGDLLIDYKTEAAALACPADKINERWTVDMTGEVTSVQPGP